MLRNRVTALLIMSLFTIVPAVQAEKYAVDNSHTSVIFAVSHMGYSYCYGRFNTVAGSFDVDDGNPAAATFNITIDANSIDSNDKKRDEHLRSPDFFNAKQFPTITFVSKSVQPTRDGLSVTGDMTLHGVTKPMTLDMRRLGTGPGPGGGQRTGFFLQTAVKRSDFGMSGMTEAVGDDVSITISVEGVAQ